MRLWVSLWLLVLGASLYPQSMPDVRSMLADVFPVSQVKPGMKGYGLTVFRGTKIERFEVEVIGVLEQANWGRPLVMVKMKGGPITERNAMIIAGMSGSPVYINNKILGAIAYGFTFPREPVGLVTPLEDMLTELDPKVARAVWEWSESRTIAQPIRIGGQQYAGVHIGFEQPSAPNFAWALPLTTPVMVSGVSHRTMERLKQRLERFGLTPVMAPAGVSQRSLSVQFEPGAALGGAIITGDIDLTAIGTLTYRKGDYVLGFGHPFFGMGKIEMPMTAAEIVDVFSSYLASFKLGNRAQTLGTIYQDGAFAIAGRMRHNCSMMPIRVRVTNTETGISRSFSCEIVRHPLILATFGDIPIVEFLSRVHFAMGHAGAMVRWSLATQPYGVIRYENRVATSLAIEGEVSRDLQYVMNLLLNAPEGEVRLESLDVEVVITPGRATAFVESVQVDKPAYRPGERVQINATVRPPDASAPRTYTLSIRLPYDLMPGSYRLQVGAPTGQAPSLPPLFGILLDGIGGGTSSMGTEAALREFQRRERNYQLVASLALRTPTVSVRGIPLYQPSPILRSVLAQPRSSELTQDMDQLKQVVDTEWVLEGSHTIMLTILPPEAREDRQSAFASAFAGEGAGEEVPMSISPDEGEVMREGETSEAFRAEVGSEVEEIPTEPEAVRDEPRKPKQEKPVSRKPQQWRPSSFAQLRKGTLEGVALGADGQLRLAPQLTRFAQLANDYLWCAVRLPDGRFAVGCGGRGEILRFDPQAQNLTRMKLEGTLVSALTAAEDDTLYAGTSPEGMVYRVQGERAEAVVDTQARYVNALLWQEGTLYIATGAPARLLAWDGRTVRLLLTTDESHFSALAIDAQRNLYVGTSERGIVYRVSPDGAISAIADLQEPSVTALLCTEDGTLFIGTMPSGNLYRLTAKGELQSLHSQGKLSIHALSRQGNQLIALARDGVYRADLTAERPTVEMVARSERALISGVASEDGMYLFSAEGEGWQLVGHSQEGSYTSPVLDARQQARWGTLQVGATLPEGTELLVQTRSGNTREPDASWSAWTTPIPYKESITLLSPPARFLQVRFQLKGNEARSPVVHQFSVSYLPANRPPEVRLLSPKPYAVLSGKQTLRWSARDPDGDTLRFEPQLSQDGGITWSAIKDGKPSDKPQPTPPSKSKEAGKSDQQLLNEMLAELEANPDLPESVKEQIRRDAPQLVAQMRQAQAQAQPTTSEEPSSPSEAARSQPNRHEWDTAQVPDGVYLLRLMATDQPSMPTDYATVYTPPIPIAVCNTPPALVVHEQRISVQADGRVVIEGFALQRRLVSKSDGSQSSAQQERAVPLISVPITAVQYRVGNGEWVSAEPIDGMFDSGFEPFRIRIENLPAGEHTLQILAFNAGGKTTQIEQKITVPKRE